MSRRTAPQRDKLSDRVSPPILVDAMLGNVARDLRLLGFDAAYAGHASDAEVLRQCQQEGRLLVTRDRQLALRAESLRCVFVTRTGRCAQTLEVLQSLGVTATPSPFSRCLECNEPLQGLSPALARSRVPDHVALTQERFVACPRCHRVFWEGSHLTRLRGLIRRYSKALQDLSRPV